MINLFSSQLNRDGCPNCECDETMNVVHANAFKLFVPLVSRGKFGKRNELFECNKCGALWLYSINGHFLHLLYPSAKELFFKFYHPTNILPEEYLSILNQIGSHLEVESERLYPVSVITKSGEQIPRAMIHISEQIWPINLKGTRFNFVENIESILESSEAMTFEQRQAWAAFEDVVHFYAHGENDLG